MFYVGLCLELVLLLGISVHRKQLCCSLIFQVYRQNKAKDVVLHALVDAPGVPTPPHDAYESSQLGYHCNYSRR